MDREAWRASVHGIARESDTTISNYPTITRAEGTGWGEQEIKLVGRQMGKFEIPGHRDMDF